MTSGYYRASVKHLLRTNVLVYTRACVSVCARYRLGENNSACVTIPMCMFCFCDLKQVLFVVCCCCCCCY